MKKFNELKDIAKNYASEKRGKETILDGPLFRIENDSLCFMYLVVEFNDEEKQDYRYKRPKEWLIQDIVTGEILDYYHINEKDFSTEEALPLDKLFENNGKSPLFDCSNLVLSDFYEWRKNVNKKLLEKINSNILYDEKILKMEDNIISPKDFILANIEDAFDDMFNILLNGVGSTIGNAFELYSESLFESIRNKYKLDKTIDYKLIKKYMNFLKYSWPELIELYNKCSNIPEALDDNFDNKLKKDIS